ncbi:2-aminoethylphosphonate--pyruvate transaminase-like [Watersipora subatra]|uniref:2-aminoethylphosphonate--pyruvate transaminase-like n=1 Tax=Watersipora subatra TaxID=2589382 RepID=UPI00355B3A46
MNCGKVVRRLQLVHKLATSYRSSQHKSCAAQGSGVKLFMPGPLNTTATVKAAMLKDISPRDEEFVKVLAYLRKELLKVAGVSDEEFIAVPMQGCATFSVEATLQTTVPRSSTAKVLVLSGGAFADRMINICKCIDVQHESLPNATDSAANMEAVEKKLRSTKYSNVCVIHCDTSSGFINPVDEIGSLVRQWQPDCSYIVDAISSFGGMSLPTTYADFIITSTNKCVQGVPGCAFVIARKSKLVKCKGNSRSVCFDLYDQYKTLNSSGVFRFTPPTQALLAIQQAFLELEQEGGVEGRARRYKTNNAIIREGMERLGFVALLPPQDSSYIVTSFKYPSHPNFDFGVFHKKLQSRGQVLPTAKVTKGDVFRIANIGDLHPADMDRLLDAVVEVCDEMDIKL